MAYTLHNNPSLAAHRAANDPHWQAAGGRSTEDGLGALEAVAVGGAAAAGAAKLTGSAVPGGSGRQGWSETVGLAFSAASH